MDKRFLKLNIGGQQFMLYRSSLCKHPESKLAALSQDSPYYVAESGEYFFDASPRYVDAILDAYRDNGEGNVEFGPDTSAIVAMGQLEYWGLDPSLLSAHTRQRYLHELDLLHKVIPPHSAAPSGRRGAIYNFLEFPRSSRAAMGWSIFYHIVIAVSLFIFMLETKPAFDVYYMQHFEGYDTLTTGNDFYSFEHSIGRMSFWFVVVCIDMVLLMEHIWRFCAAPCQRTFYKYVFNLTDMLGIYPEVLKIMAEFILFIVLRDDSTKSIGDVRIQIPVIQCMVLFRCFRFVRLVYRFCATRIILYAILEAITELLAWVVCFGVAMLLFANVAYFTELNHDDSHFISSFDSLWWAVVTLTTVGYGDMCPIGLVGKIGASFCMLFAVMSMGVTSAVLTHHIRKVHMIARGIPANVPQAKYLQMKAKVYMDTLSKYTDGVERDTLNEGATALIEQTALMLMEQM